MSEIIHIETFVVLRVERNFHSFLTQVTKKLNYSF